MATQVLGVQRFFVRVPVRSARAENCTRYQNQLGFSQSAAGEADRDPFYWQQSSENQMTDVDKRVWYWTGYGWASRPPNKQDKEREALMSRWFRGEIDYSTVRKELKNQHIDVDTTERKIEKWL